jgi:hypothetical protein
MIAGGVITKSGHPEGMDRVLAIVQRAPLIAAH